MNIRIQNIAVFIAASVILAACAAAQAQSVSPAVPTGTVNGYVISSVNIPLAGVVVSDGIVTTVTDSTGYYAIDSDKSTGYVFVSLPGDYTVDCSGSRPQFFQYTEAPANEPERHDFTLRKVDNSRYAVIVQTDQHLAGRLADVHQFKSLVLPDINATIDECRDRGIPVYSISLGDTSWDGYWYDNGFSISDASRVMDLIECPVFATMGNHDNNPYVAEDRGASSAFRDAMMPPYYSFNIGDTHYVMLDNVVYHNDGGAEGKVGKRNYDCAITPEQMEWLRQDLSYIADKSAPVVIGAHVPFYKAPRLQQDGTETTIGNIDNIAEFEQALSGFTDVTLFCGHLHRNSSMDVPHVPGMRQHILAAVCGSMWWTASPGYTSRHICTDGSPGGYGVLEVNGRDASYRYKGAGLPADYRFRVYDLNEVVINEDFLKDPDMLPALEKITGQYGKNNRCNELLVNVFAYAPGWRVEAVEAGKPLQVKQVVARDPLHILTYGVQRINNGKDAGTTTRNVTHMFKVKARSATGTVTVKVTDPWDRVYEQTVERPKAFNPDIL